MVLVGTAAERDLCKRVCTRAGDRAINLAGRTGSAELAAILERSCALLGNDSGPGHLAAAVGTPVVAVFGPTDPLENAPFPGLPHRLVRRDVGCNPCREGCPARSCMAAVQVDDVVKAALELLPET